MKRNGSAARGGNGTANGKGRRQTKGGRVLVVLERAPAGCPRGARAGAEGRARERANELRRGSWTTRGKRNGLRWGRHRTILLHGLSGGIIIPFSATSPMMTLLVALLVPVRVMVVLRRLHARRVGVVEVILLVPGVALVSVGRSARRAIVGRGAR